MLRRSATPPAAAPRECKGRGGGGEWNGARSIGQCNPECNPVQPGRRDVASTSMSAARIERAKEERNMMVEGNQPLMQC